MAGERSIITPVTVTSAVNVSSGTVVAYALVGLTSIDTALWESFRLHVNVLSFDGTTGRWHFKIQHSAIDPSTVSYTPWTDLYELPPISDVGVFTADIPNDGAPRFGRWIRVMVSGVASVTETVSLGDIIIAPRG